MKVTALLLLLACGTVFGATEEETKKTFPASTGGKLVVDVDFGEINVTTNATPNEIGVMVWRKVTRRNQAEEEKFLKDHPVTFHQEDGTLVIRSRHKSQGGWFSNFRNRNEGKFTIKVPAEFNAKLDTAGGGISVSDLHGGVDADTSGGGLSFARLNGTLNGDTSGGGIRVLDCQGNIKIGTSGGGIDVAGGGGSLSGETSGGGVKVKNFAGPASVETSGGGITIEKVKGSVKGSTSGGPIHAVLLSPLPGEVNLSTSGGGVSVDIGDQAAFNLDAETSGGGVSCELPVTIQGKKERSRLKGPVNGGGPVVELRSSGGGIQVRKL
jgi:DUF4097 and DUF4098 domain-containing protein YvlB